MADDKKPKLPPPLPPRLPGKSVGAPRPPVPPSPLKGGMPPRPATPPPSAVPAPQAFTGSPEIEAMRRQMETQVNALHQQLQEEREKLLLQTVRAKEEEAMAAKVEESLKDIQDRLRREKREQELQENLAKAESQIKELEARLSQERQTWVETLRTQSSQRDSQDKEVERNFDLQLKELERRWYEEKLGWSQALKSKDEELSTLKREIETAVSETKAEAEVRMKDLSAERDSMRRELKDLAALRQQEKDGFNQKLDLRDKEYLSLKAQQAMIVTQLRQEKDKMDQVRQLLEKMRADKSALASQVDAKEKEYFLLKTQFAMYQTKSRTEQEKILKETALFKEQADKAKQQWDVTLQTKENEIALYKENLQKNEIEVRSLEKQFEEKMRARESEFKYLVEKEQADAEARVRQADEKLANAERLAKERLDLLTEMKVTLAQAGERQHRLEELADSKIKEASLAADRVQAREAELQAQISQLAEKLTMKEHALALQAEETKAAVARLNAAEQKLAVTAGEKEAFAFKEAALAKELAQVREMLAVKERECERLAATEHKLRETESALAAARETLVHKEDEITELEGYERMARQLEDAVDAQKNAVVAEREKTAHIERLRAEQDAAMKKLDEEKQDLKKTIERLEGSLASAAKQVEDARHDTAFAGADKARLEGQLAALEDKLEQARKEKEALQAAVQEKLYLQKENDRLCAFAATFEQEIARLKNEATLKEKDSAHVGQEKDAEIARLKEHTTWLQEKLGNFQSDTESEIAEREKTWKRKEESLLALVKENDDMFAELTAERDALKLEMEKYREARLELEEKSRAALQGLKEEFKEMQYQKDTEIRELKDAQKAAEDALRRDLNEKYRQQFNILKEEKEDITRELRKLEGVEAKLANERADADGKIAQLTTEKEELSRTLAKETQALKFSFESKLSGLSERMNEERAEAEQKIARKEADLEAARKKMDELTSQMTLLNSRYRRETEEKLEQERAKWENEVLAARKSSAESAEARWKEQLSQLQSRLIEQEMKLTEKNKEVSVLKDEAERSARQVIQAPAPVELPVQDRPRRDSLLTRFWKNMNEPVIEIDFKSDRDHKRLPH